MPYVFPILEAMFLPPGLLILLLIAALVLLLTGRRLIGGVLGVLAAVLLYLCSITPFADLLILPLENHYPPFVFAKAAGAHDVVVLGGGIVPRSPADGGKPALGAESLVRLVYGEEIASKTGLPIIVSGGVVPSFPASQSEAAVAKRDLVALGVSSTKILVEGKSRNTWENAAQVERLYHPGKVILVTSAYHMPRSVIAFNRNRIQVVPAPTDYLADRGGYTFYSYLPGAGALRVTAIALKEYLGYIYYRLFLFAPR